MSLNEPHFPRRKNKNNAHLNEVINTRDDDTTLNRVSFKKKNLFTLLFTPYNSKCCTNGKTAVLRDESRTVQF